MSHYQSTPRKSGARGRAVAHRLLANVGIVQSVLDATVHDEQISDAVVTFKAGRKFTLNSLIVAKGEHFTMVKSRFAHRYYVTAHGKWSTNDPKIVVKYQRLLAQAA
jgi:hypothetical protein